MFRRFTYSCYLHKDQDRAHPQVSPYHASAESFAPTTIITCSGDSLAREGKQLVDKLKNADMDVVHYEAEGQGKPLPPLCRSLVASSDRLDLGRTRLGPPDQEAR